MSVFLQDGLSSIARRKRAVSQAQHRSERGAAHPSLNDLRVLLVDDELLIQLLLEDMLEDLGCIVAGKAFRPKDALETIASTDIDVAILDIHLAGELSYGIAEDLDRRNIPFLFVTGYQKSAIAQRFRDHPRLGKPFSQDELERALRDLLINRVA